MYRNAASPFSFRGNLSEGRTSPRQVSPRAPQRPRSSRESVRRAVSSLFTVGVGDLLLSHLPSSPHQIYFLINGFPASHNPGAAALAWGEWGVRLRRALDAPGMATGSASYWSIQPSPWLWS